MTTTPTRPALPLAPPPTRPGSEGGISLTDVRMSYGSTPALELPGLEIPAGSFTVVVGPSGCGKSTMLRMIAGLATPQEGSVRVGGRDVTATAPGDRDVAMVFQDFALYPHMTVRRNVGFGLLLERRHSRHGPSRDEIDRRVVAACEQLGLAGKLERRPRELSGGERQRVALARALVRRKTTLLLDEPLSNLDAHLRVQARAELVRLHREVAGTFVLVTHDQTEALSMGTHVVLLNGGRLEQAGPPEEIWHHPRNVFVAGFLGSPPMNVLPTAGEELVGWRPSDGVLDEVPAPGTATFDGDVEIVEFVGDRRLAHCTGPDGRWAVELAPDVSPPVGGRVRVRVDRARLHHFDARTGVHS